MAYDLPHRVPHADQDVVVVEHVVMLEPTNHMFSYYLVDSKVMPASFVPSIHDP